MKIIALLTLGSVVVLVGLHRLGITTDIVELNRWVAILSDSIGLG